MKKRSLVSVLSILMIVILLAAEMPLVVFADNDTEETDNKEEDADEEDEDEDTSQKSSSSSKKKSADVINNKIQESQSAISEAEQQKNKLQSGMKDVKVILGSLESTKKNLKNYVTVLDSNLTEIQTQLEELNNSLDEKQEAIQKSKDTLEIAKEDEKIQYEAMKKRIRFMYEKRDDTFWELLLSSKGFGDFLNKTQYIAGIVDYDQAMLDQLIDTKNQIVEIEKNLVRENGELQKIQLQIEEDQNSVETLINAKEQEIKVYDSDISNKEKLIKEYEDEIAAQNATIKSLESAIAAEKKKLQAENGTVATYDGGQFTFPCPNYSRISDDYGNRMHPILGIQQFHNGVDLAASNGSPILAAYDGNVIAAAYSSTMGNYLMIDHGDGLFTIYMHASSLLVSTGASVTKGQKIALVGSTGRSTGPHLHFSVRLNGSYVSPWNYLK